MSDDPATENQQLRRIIDKFLLGTSAAVHDGALHVPAGPRWGCSLTPEEEQLIADVKANPAI
jgi:hypothetical protein